jgi:hypothetical protein
MPPAEQKMHSRFLESIEGIFRKILGIQAPFTTLTEFSEQFASGIPYPIEETAQDSGGIIYLNRFYNNTVPLSSHIKPKDLKRMIQSSPDISSVEDMLLLAERCNVTCEEEFIPGHDIYQSSRIFSSAHVFRSQEVHNSHYVSFSSHITNSYQVSASHNARNAEYCMRIFDSSDCSYAFNIINCLGIKSSFFLRNCKNCKHCMFSYDLTDKTFCIGNRQYTSNDYYNVRNILFENFPIIFSRWVNRS